ncbi:hypothetical protein DAEQUDRAFT_808945 [Daedalea quercina L-15889]|uniref:Uncharacterized protein n=1 Tax=Daedalea quercina L-15889 TaxID=1314783 RepID=A0A165STZ9_9APHY|nr:hypothetical protein DAEQUDRAFT_808945 [Daedalea quercina L-15889]
MVDEHSDILGGHLQKVPPQSYKAWMVANPIYTAAVAVVFSLLSYFVLIPAFNRWQDRRYRKALRRRYGIPDDDERPFAIAYAAARARTDESEDGSREASEQPEEGDVPRRRARSDVPMLVRRQLEGEDVAHFREPEVPHSASHAPYVAQYDPRQVVYNAWQTGPSATLVGDAVIRDYVRPSAQREPASLATILPGILSNPAGKDPSLPTLKTHGKHARDDDETEQPEKKSRLAGTVQEVDEGIVVDGDDTMDVDLEVVQPKRGAKRQADVEDDEGIEQTRASGRDKRARKVSRGQASELSGEDEAMPEAQVESDGDEATEMQSVQRGKKRDRDEAGSTFGGDESVVDDVESDGGHKFRRRRKRRAMAKNTEDVGRGQKRTRDDAEEESEESDRPKRRDTRRQRGDRDLGFFDAPLSNDPLCKGRKIGEEWEVNGINYKVGPNGQRLRQELVKRSRIRFPMPRDSDHPDRRTNIDVYVETWLTEEQYQVAKEHGALAWQDSPTPSAPATPGDVSDFPSGKSLLWSSTSSTSENPAPQRGPFGQSIVTNVGLRFDPFHQSQLAPRRRVSSIPQLPVVTTTPEPSPSKPRSSKTYSKWEKQDLEAAAMAKIREKKLAEAREANKATPPPPPPPQAATQLSVVPAAAPSVPSVPAVPSLTFAKPAEREVERSAQSAGDKPSTSFFLGPPPAPAASTLSSSGAPASTATLAPAKEAPKSFFSIPPPSNSTTTPAVSIAQQSSSVPNFFGNSGKNATPGVQVSQPSIQPQSTSSAPAATALNFGAKPAPAPGSAPLFNPFGGAPKSAQASATPAISSFSAPKSAFSLAPPASSATTAATNTSAEKQPASTGTTAGPSLLARLGPQVQESSATQVQPNAPASGSPLKFSFTQPSAPAAGSSVPQSAFAQPSTPTSASIGGTAPASTTPAGTPTAAASNTSTTPAQKFSFGFPGAKPASAAVPASSTPAAPATTNQAPSFSFSFGAKPSTPATQLSGDASKPFGGFGASGQTTTATSTPSGAKTPAAFGFGAPASSNATAGPNPFGAPSTLNTSTVTTPNKPAGTNAFSTTPAGTPTSGNVFGGNSGSSTNTAAPKSAFPFGTTGGTPAFGSAGMSSTQPSAASAFGAAAGGTAPTTTSSGEAQGQPAFSFNFGAAPAASSTTPSNPFGAKPANNPTFGASSQPNSFNFGNTTSSTPSSFTFSNTNQNQKQ